MTLAAVFSLASLGLFSLADLRYRTAPGVALFFLAAVAIGARADPLRVGLVVLAVAWGALRAWPALLILLPLLHPSTWAVLLAGAGTRQNIIGKSDLLALGGLACIFEWPAIMVTLVGVELWRRFWGRRQTGPVPALPGMFLGLGGYLFWQAILQS
jgi:hypothetical protein